jgi:hypothetical protein
VITRIQHPLQCGEPRKAPVGKKKAEKYLLVACTEPGITDSFLVIIFG